MGLDSVELVIEVEERFGVSIPDKDAEELATVGQLIDYVIAAKPPNCSEYCQTSRSFYRVRRVLMEQFRIPRVRVRLDSPLEEIIPMDNRRLHWELLGQKLPRLPNLDISKRTFDFCVTAAIITSLIAGLASSSIVMGVVLFFPVSLAFIVFAYRRAATIPAFARTVRDLTLCTCQHANSPEEIALLVRSIVSAQSGLTLDKITRDTRFVADLGF